MSEPSASATEAGERPSLAASILAGLVAGLLAVTFMFSYSAVILTGDLAPFVPRLTGHFLLGAVVLAVIVGIASQFSGVVAVPQDNPTAVLAVVVVSVTASSKQDLPPEELFTTIVVLIALSTFAGAAMFWLVGRFHLAVMAQYVPYPVVAGFLAATGWLLFKGSFGVMSGVGFDLGHLGDLVSVAELWLPGLAFALVLLVVGKVTSNVFAMPGVIIGAIGLFHLTLAISGDGRSVAIANGWLLQPFDQGMLLQSISPDDIDWAIVTDEIAGLGTVLVIAVISVLLNITALSSALGDDVDVDREMRVLGFANLAAGAGGSLVGYHYVSLSTLGRRMRGGGPVVALVVALTCFAAMTVASGALAYIPRFVLGGMVLFIGLSFLDDWLVQSIRKLARSDVVVIAAILAVVELVGFLEGVAAGLIATVILFMVSYSRISVVRHTFTGRELRSTIERQTAAQARLEQHLDGVLLLKLHGYVFFASTVGLLESVRQRLDDEETIDTHLILDFEHVTGVDTSALHGLAKLKSLTADRGIKLLDCAVPASISAQFRSQTFLDGDASVELEFATSDEALEWCEDDILRGEGIDPGEDEFSFDFMLREMFETDEHMAEFAAMLETLEFAPGSILIESGGEGHYLDIVETGHVEVLAADGSRLRRAGPGSLLGIASFFRHGAHHSLVTIRAIETCTVRRLTGEAYLDLMFDNPDVAAGLQRHALVLLSDRFDRTLGTLERVLRATS